MTPGEQITIGLSSASNGGEQVTIGVSGPQNQAPEQITLNLSSNQQLILISSIVLLALPRRAAESA